MLKRGLIIGILIGGLILVLSTYVMAGWTTKTVEAGSFYEQVPYQLNSSNLYVIYHQNTNALRLANSSDGGATWTTQQVTAGPVGFLNGLYVKNETNIYIIYYYNTVPQACRVVYSTDAGATWNTETIESGINTCYVHSLVSDGNKLYLARRDGTAITFSYANISDMTEWVDIATGFTVQNYPMQMSSPDGQNFFIAYHGAATTVVDLANSSDGGLTWSTQTMDSQATGIQRPDVWAKDANTIYYEWVFGTSMYLRNSSDAGATWTEKVVDSSVDDRIAYIDGYGDQVYLWAMNAVADPTDYKSVDGGNTFSGTLVLENQGWIYSNTYAYDYNNRIRSSHSPSPGTVYLSVYSALVPNITEFTGGRTTDFSSVDLAAIDGMILENSFAAITWAGTVVADNQGFDENIQFGDGFVSINSHNLDSSINTSAEVEIFNLDGCYNVTVYYSPQPEASLVDLKSNGQVCNATTTPACTNIQCTSGTVTFDVPHFDSFGAEGDQDPGAVPEFSTVAMIIALLGAVMGFFVIRQKVY
ncbi:glycoside hydrolase [Candidatus Woesearchaeota archaeon]|nr:glycoside hydrolase [Candidatus Woesearchaeota archaeon]